MQDELINSTSTVAGTAIGSFVGQSIGSALHSPNLSMTLGLSLGAVGGYAGNLIRNTPKPELVREKIHQKVTQALSSSGMTQAQINEAFKAYNPTEPLPSPSVLKNIGNLLSTNITASIFSPIGVATTTALTTTLGKGIDKLAGTGNKIASVGFVVGMLGGAVIGKLGGGYLGNKLFSGPNNDYVEQESRSFVQRVMIERHIAMISGGAHAK